MFIRIFKIFSSLGLIIVLAVLISKREVIFTHTNNVIAETSKTSELRPPEKPSQVPQSPTKVIEAQSFTPKASSSKTNPLLPAIAQEKTTIKKVTELAKKSLYIPMVEGTSDTVPSYRPVVSPCDVTMGYTIGTFDTHFGISQAKFIEEVDKAASLWGDQLGKTLFKYNKDGPLIINLIYDARQANTEEANNLALEIQNSKDAADTLKSTYDAEKSIYLGNGEQLTRDSDAFKVRYDTYAAKVTTYNNQGGAPRDEYEAMTKELDALKQESISLTKRRDELNSYMETINMKVNHYNELVVYINSLIAKSNALGTQKFTEGRFSPRTTTIDIYQYNDILKLRRVIAHELGHVLGINHNDSIHSIMYSFNSATSTYLSGKDIQSLYEVCPQN